MTPAMALDPQPARSAKSGERLFGNRKLRIGKERPLRRVLAPARRARAGWLDPHSAALALLQDPERAHAQPVVRRCEAARRARGGPEARGEYWFFVEGELLGPDRLVARDEDDLLVRRELTKLAGQDERAALFAIGGCAPA